MDEKELAKRLNEIHNKHRAALEAHTTRLGTEDNARKWLRDKAKLALDVLAGELNKSGRGIQASVNWNPMKQAVTLRLVYRDDTMFLYSVGLKTSVEGVAADIRTNDKPFEDIPEKPILDWTQDDFQEVFLKGYGSWQPNA
ncbi:MAG: hypothetical protein ABFE13_25565 [Phycisphaerales bacterium]